MDVVKNILGKEVTNGEKGQYSKAMKKGPLQKKWRKGMKERYNDDDEYY